MSRLEPNLPVSEAQLGEPGCRVDLIPAPVGRLLRRGAVVGEAVRLHHQAELRPPEVDSVAIDYLPREGYRELRVDRKWDEQALELGVGEAERRVRQRLT